MVWNEKSELSINSNGLVHNIKSDMEDVHKMTKPIVKKCIDCGNKLGSHRNGNKHHFRCDKCWLKYMADYDKHKLKLKKEKK